MKYGECFQWSGAKGNVPLPDPVGSDERPHDAEPLPLLIAAQEHSTEATAALEVDGVAVESTVAAVAEVLVSKTVAQQTAVREHLARFEGLFDGAPTRLEEFVRTFPFHPDSIKIAGRLPGAWTGGVLTFLSKVLELVTDQEVDPESPGLIAIDRFWDALQNIPAARNDPAVEAITRCCGIIDRWIAESVPPADRGMAGRLARALCVRRLIVPGTHNRNGLTPTELKDLLSLVRLPRGGEEDAADGDLLTRVNAVLEQLLASGDGQVVVKDAETNRYALRVGKLKRFVAPELVLHWMNAVPFVMLMMTGLAMLASRFFRVEPKTFALVFGIHKTCAAVWVIGLPLTVLIEARLHWRQHILPVLTWRWDDFLWLIQSSRSLYNRKARIPDAERFNAGQKINACLVMLYFAGFGATGALMLWKPSILIPWYAHTALFFAALGSVGGHLYLALINPSTRIALGGIFHGWAPIEYIEHHHPLSLPAVFRSPAAPEGNPTLKAVLVEARIEMAVFVFAALLAVAGVLVVGHGRLAVAESTLAENLPKVIQPDELSTKHQIGETSRSCVKCHSLNGEIPDGKCEQCHAVVKERRATGIGYHGTLKGNCIHCHKEHLGPAKSIVPLDPKTFDHNLASFKREGKHKALECDECHRKKRTPDTPGSYYIGLPHRSCTDCHRDPHNRQFDRPCETCHTVFGWKGPALLFSHATNSTFHLEGKHAAADCAKCHKPKWPWQPRAASLFKGLPTDCAGCHEDPHRKQFKAACDVCHTPSGWTGKALLFSHATNSTYRLEGKHAAADCAKCHKPSQPRGPLASATFTGLSTDCISCHEDPHLKRLPACVTCHTPAGWKRDALKFDHNRDSKFPLTARHAETDCIKCHRPPAAGLPLGRAPFVELGTDCADCHTDPHRGQFERSCTKCHPDSSTWRIDKSRFDHARLTRFALVGKHVLVDCIKCHTPQPDRRTLGSATFKGLGTTCEACHKVNHPDTYGSACLACHTQDVWPPKMKGFEHLAKLRLIGKHFSIPCSACHNEKRMGPIDKSGAKTYTCVTCHQVNDPHQGTLGSDCTRCHTMLGWKGDDLLFDHNTMTSYALNKDHENVACAKCHEKGRWKPLSTTCEGCHPKFLRKEGLPLSPRS